MGYSPNTIFCSLSIALYHHEPKFFIHHPTMMLYPTNSAGRRQQQPCTTTIRSRRAHPRRVLDTAALNAYVPDDVGSKSQSELTWNHVVGVFTFFGLLMTVLVSLCCWSHCQYIVESRRLAAEEFSTTSIMDPIYRNPMPCYRRRLADTKMIKVKGAGAPGADGKYLPSSTVPDWFKNNKSYSGIKKYIDGSGAKKTKWAEAGNMEKDFDQDFPRNPEGWKKLTDNRPWFVDEDHHCIFFCVVQGKWHLCGPEDGLLYRAPALKSADAKNAVPNLHGEYDDVDMVSNQFLQRALNRFRSSL